MTKAPQFVGNFRELPHGNPAGPSLKESIDRGEREHIAGLVNYLTGGAVLAMSGQAARDPLDPQSKVIGELSLRTDGEWLWYSDLSHFVEKYNIEIDPKFIKKAESRDWNCPHISDDDLETIGDIVFGEEE
ncbi:hypothetical protein ACFWG5_33095 [Streptomyces hydrogenans]|uniref:hypothetical protein n=1 Tax=Streptomyces hydrogenans TaxID=1873719 RepID=UPI0036591422